MIISCDSAETYGRLQIHAPEEGAFVLDQSQLDGPDTLYPWETGVAKPGYSWHDIQGDASSIDIVRGANLYENLLARFETGTMTITFQSDNNDPFLNKWLDSNQEVRLQVRRYNTDTTWETIFTGNVRDFSTVYDPIAAPVVTMTVFDHTYRIAQRETFTTPDEQTYVERMNAIATEAGLTAITDTGTFTHAPVENPINAWDAANKAANAESGLVFVNREGDLVATASTTASAQSTPVPYSNAPFSPSYSYAFAGGQKYDPNMKIIFDTNHGSSASHQCFTAIDAVYSTETIINKVIINNIEQTDLSGGDIVDTYGPYVDATSKGKYGERDMTFELNIKDGATHAQTIAESNMLKEPLKHIRGIQFSPELNDAGYRGICLDIGEEVRVQFQQINSDHLVTGIAHNITPEDWLIDLELWKEKLI